MNAGRIIESTIGSIGTVATTAALGATAGTVIGGNLAGSNNIEGFTTGAVVGGVVGGAVSLGAVGLTYYGINNPKKVGGAIKDGVVGATQAVGGMAIGATEALGGAAIGVTKAVGTGAMIAGAAVAPLATHMLDRTAAGAAGFASKLVKPAGANYKGPTVFGNRLSGFGAAMILGSGLVNSTIEGFDEVQRNHMGRQSEGIYRATPVTPSYANNGGATGDLVFALNQNRKG